MLSSLKHRRGRTVAVRLAVVAGLGASTSALAASPLDPRLAAVAKAHPTRKVDVIVQFKPGTSPHTARSIVRFHHGRVTRRLKAVKGYAVKLKARDAVKLRRSRRVRMVTLNA